MAWKQAIVLLTGGSLAIVAMALGWRAWFRAMLQRRQRLYQRMADDLGLAHVRDPAAAGLELVDVDECLHGAIAGREVLVYERLQQYRLPGAPIDTQTTVEVRGTFGLPEFALLPCRDRAIQFLTMLAQDGQPIRLYDSIFELNNFIIGADPAAVFALFSGEVRRLFYGNDGVALVCAGDSLRFFRYEALLEADGVNDLIARANRFLDAVRDGASDA